LFIHHLSRGGDAHVSLGGGGAGPRGFTNVEREVASARWLDNDEALRFVQEQDLLCIEATGYPYGVDRVVRIAEIR
jgi:alpha-L-fucosidase